MLSYTHSAGTPLLTGDTLDAALRRSVERFPDHEAVVSLPQGRRLTYAELDREVERLARGLLALGVRRGERVGIWSTDNVEWIFLQAATARVGAILVNINPAYKPAELRYALAKARVQVLFLVPGFRSSDYVAMALEACPGLESCPADELRCDGLPGLRHALVYDPDDPLETTRPAAGFLTWGELLARGEATPDEDVLVRASSLDCDDPINLQFTSGTTGSPKAVVLTHHNLLNNARLTAEAMGLTHEDRLCVPVPFYHCFGMDVSNLGCLVTGATIVIPAPHFDPEATLAAIASERCTVLHGVPTMFVAELERPDFRRFDLSSLRTGIMAGAPCPPEVVRRVMEDMGCREILIGYGQTEASPVTHLTRRDDSFERRLGTVGASLPHLEVKLVDIDSGVTVPVGEHGEICLRGYQVMRGYFEDEQATREAIDRAGWLHSGDIGVLDEDGYLAITGRIKNMIIRGGENVYPAEIEAAFHEHPEVVEIAVFGISDPRMGEEVGAWVQLRPGARVDEETLAAWAKGRIAHFKVPRRIWFVDEFPMTVTGKIQKFRIREVVEQWLQEERAAEKKIPS